MLTDPAKLFRPEAIEAKNIEGMGRIVIARPISFSLLTALIATFLAIVVIVLINANYARQERVVGRLLPAEDFAQIFAPRNGLVKDIHVEEGNFVEKGQALILLESETFVDNGDSLTSMVVNELHNTQDLLSQTIVNEQELQKNSTEESASTIRFKTGELNSLTQLINTYHKRLAISEKDFLRHQALHRQGQIADVEFNRLHKEYLSEQVEFQRLEKEKDNLVFLINQIKYEQEQIIVTHKKNIAELNLRLADIRRELAEKSVESQFLIKAPISGIISGLEYRKGRKVTTAQPLMTILPESGELLAELYVPTRAVGFVNVGMDVRLRYDAFPYQKFGTYSGKIENISKSVFLGENIEGYDGSDKTFYKLIVSLGEQKVTSYQREFSLQSGMQLSAYLVGEKRSLMEWFFEPIYAYTKKS